MHIALLIRTPNNNGLILWCAVGIGAGIFLFFYGFRLLQRRRLIMDTPFSKIRSASMGMVEISGLAVGPYTITAPITRRESHFYRTMVWEYKRGGKNSEWVKIASECAHVPFFVDDNTGTVLISPRGADLDLHCDFHQEFSNSMFSTLDSTPETVRDFLGRHGIATDNKIKVEEYCIKPKNALFIVGTLAENPGLEVTPVPIFDNEHNLSGTAPLQRISIAAQNLMGKMTDSSTNDDVLVGQPVSVLPTPAAKMNTADPAQQQKIASALLRAGISNPAAWSAAGLGSTLAPVSITPQAASGAGGNPASHDGSGKGFDAHPATVLMKGTNNPTFMISWRSQREVVQSLGWKSMLMIFGGPALVLLSLYVLLNIVHL